MKINLKKFLGIGVTALAGTVTVLAAISKSDELSNFLKNATDEELDIEREKVRLDYCNPHLDEQYRTECHKKLERFDDEMSKRAWGDEEPHAPSYHREHGWYLPNDD